MKLYVGNLSTQTTDSRLDELMKGFGSPSPARVIKDKATGESRGFAFVEFTSDDEARKAIAGLHGKEIDGNVLTVNEARPSKNDRVAK
jgi:RNA recognition motif-containing protein